MPACFSEQGGSHRRGGASAQQITGAVTMTYLTKKQLQERFIEEFLRRLREAPEGERVYMRVGDLFKLADVHSLDELRAARRTRCIDPD
jgi:hypothetical protein